MSQQQFQKEVMDELKQKETTMKVYQALNAARAEFHTLQLKKSGKNAFAGYSYFELSDFLIPALGVFAKHGLCAYISFGKEVATMRIVAIEDGSSVELTSPMAEANLKGCHPIQNLGAVETYTRRYLWVAALEIVEHDAVDSSKPVDKVVEKVVHSPVQPGEMTDDRIDLVCTVAEAIRAHMADSDIVGAYEEASGITDPEEKQYLWKLLDSKTRSAIKRHAESLKEAA